MADITENEIELDKIIKEVEKSIKDLGKNKKSTEFRGVAELIKNRINRSKQILRSYRLDLRELPKKELANYDSKVKNYEEQIKKLENDLNWVENILVNNDNNNNDNDNNNNNNNNNNDNNNDIQYQNVMKKAKDIQQQDIKTTKGILQTVIETNNIGTATSEQMKIQEEQINRIKNDMDVIDSNLKLATRQMRSIARKMATDKIILGLILLIVAGIIVVIVYKTLK
ncbi:hypothetical protein ACTFIZ_001446 [Dictyostelium cf. discoideum]